MEPARWCLSQFGVFLTSLGPKPVGECVGPKLSRYRHFMPVVDISDQLADETGVPQSLEQFAHFHWQQAITEAQQVNEIADLVEGVWVFYVEAAARVPAPAQIVAYSECRTVVAPPAAVHATDDRERFVALQEIGIPTVLVATRASVEAITNGWGCTEGVAVVRFEPTGEREPLFDVFPGLEP